MESKLSEEKSVLSARQGTLQREQAECTQAAIDLGLVKKELSSIKQRLNNLEFSPVLQLQLSDIDSKIASISYDQALHEALKSEVLSSESFISLEQQLKEAKVRYDQEIQSLTTLNKLLESRKEDQLQTITEIEKITKELNQLPVVKANVQSQEMLLNDLNSQRSYLETQASGHKTRLQDIEEVKQKQVEITKTIKNLEQEVSAFSLLTEAFGKRGIQALLIEAALPELESEANQLLSRLTDNRLSLTLETQRQNRRGETTETLEIQIGDELGTRSYELFSGGEAFRINFALRIALAKLLASRVGAPLKTLFLDEGFGTQDTEGRERLIQAIRSVQDDFDLILVITHIDELKEAFPVRIEVTKTDQGGSTFRLTWA
ncbi:hypothetical protein FIM02_01680 [SAR202 cluster bacterium AD-802-E10_MRT_200m]|nr:hypothetical protein [SAR202 cluster bacterium AD-802-E10_MRT_200m]